MSRLNQRGFTILELLIATMVFSVVFLGATTAIMQIGRLYYKGVVTGRTQEVVRSLTDSIAQQIQFSDGGVVPALDTSYSVINGPQSGKMTYKAYCIGDVRFSYVLNAQFSSTPSDGSYDDVNYRLNHVLWRDNVTNGANSCTPANLSLKQPVGGTDGKELLALNMRLSNFTISCDSNNLCNLGLRAIYGDNDLMSGDPTITVPTRCKSIVGSQWCATSELNTTVLKRLGVN